MPIGVPDETVDAVLKALLGEERYKTFVAEMRSAAKTVETETETKSAENVPVLPKKERKRGRGHMRSTLEERLGAEMKKMREESRGTPLFDGLEDSGGKKVRELTQEAREDLWKKRVLERKGKEQEKK